MRKMKYFLCTTALAVCCLSGCGTNNEVNDAVPPTNTVVNGSSTEETSNDVSEEQEQDASDVSTEETSNDVSEEQDGSNIDGTIGTYVKPNTSTTD